MIRETARNKLLYQGNEAEVCHKQHSYITDLGQILSPHQHDSGSAVLKYVLPENVLLLICFFEWINHFGIIIDITFSKAFHICISMGS